MSTKNVVPRASNEGKIGTSVKRWLEGHFGNLFKSGVEVATVTDVSDHASRTDNPHSVSKAQVGLGNVPNTDATARSSHTGTQAQSTVTGLEDALAERVVGPGSSVNDRVALFNGTTGKLLKVAASTISDLLARSNHTGTQTKSTISDFDHASTHGQGGSDPVKLDDLATPDDNTDLNASASRHGLLPKLSGSASDRLAGDGTWVAGDADYTDDDAKDAVGGAITTTNSLQLLYDGINRIITGIVRRKTASLVSGAEGEIAETSSGICVKLGTTGTTAAAGNDSRFARKVSVPVTSSSSGQPGDYALSGSDRYDYTGDGATHSWVKFTGATEF